MNGAPRRGTPLEVEAWATDFAKATTGRSQLAAFGQGGCGGVRGGVADEDGPFPGAPPGSRPLPGPRAGRGLQRGRSVGAPLKRHLEEGHLEVQVEETLQVEDISHKAAVRNDAKVPTAHICFTKTLPVCEAVVFSSDVLRVFVVWLRVCAPSRVEATSSIHADI